MRRPSLGQNEDDLSRLTTIISPTSISLSSNGQSDPVVVVDHHDVVSCGRAKAHSTSISHGAGNTTSNSSSNCPASNNSVSGPAGRGSVDGGSSTTSNSSNGINTSTSTSSDGVKVIATSKGKGECDGRGTAGGLGGGRDELSEALPPPTVLVNQYLPNLINSSEWQNCRKRKERQDSTSSISQDRKLIRSNSEEHLPNCQEVIRRVSSHEDFKKRSAAAAVVSVEISIDKENVIAEEPLEGEDEQQQQVFEKNLKNSADDLKKFFIGSVESIGGKEHHHHHHHSGHLAHNNHHNHHHGNHVYHHLGGHHHHLHHGGGKSQPSHHRLSPCRDILKSRRDSDSEQDGEHERRRHCERFSKTRPPPGRKSVSPRARNSSKHSKLAVKAASVGVGAVLLAGNEHFYSKHDTHPSGGGKSERRIRSSSKHREQQQKVLQDDTVMDDGVVPLSDYNDNNVLEKNHAVEEATKLIDNEEEEEVQPEEPLSPREKLPWGQTYPDDTPALVCQRFADDNFEYAKRMDSVSHAKLRPVSSGNSLKLYGAHHRSAENAPPSTIHHHHHHHQKATPAANNMFDERVKAINRKLGGLKKKLSQFEDRFELEHGYRPTHGDKSADAPTKSILVEIHKLRKEKNQIKADLAVFSAKVAAAAATMTAATGQKQQAATGDGGLSEDETATEKHRKADEKLEYRRRH